MRFREKERLRGLGRCTTMTLEEVVLCSGGLRVAQRGAELPADVPVLAVKDVAVVPLPDSPPVEARSTEHLVWRRHWLEEHRLVIQFVDLANVEVDRARGTVVFDRWLSPEMEQHLLFDHVLPLALAAGGALVLHGAVISRAGKGLLLVGASGAGKSTTTAFAWQRGWTVGGDDGAVLFATNPPAVEPTYPTVRLTPASARLLALDTETTSAVAGKRRIAADGSRPFRQDRVELVLVAIIEPAGADSTARFERLAPVDAHAKLFGSTFHACLSHGPLLAAAVDGLASIVESTPVGRLTVPRDLAGLAATERLLDSLIENERSGDGDLSGVTAVSPEAPS